MFCGLYGVGDWRPVEKDVWCVLNNLHLEFGSLKMESAETLTWFGIYTQCGAHVLDNKWWYFSPDMTYGRTWNFLLCGLWAKYHTWSHFCSTLYEVLKSTPSLCPSQLSTERGVWSTVIPRLTKIIRSGITFVSRKILAVSNVNNPVGLVCLPYVMWSAHFFVTYIQTEKISSWNGPTVHVCCFMLARSSTKTFVSRIHIR